MKIKSTKKKEDSPIQVGLDVGNMYIKAAAISQSASNNKLIAISVKPVGDNIIKAVKDAHAELKIPQTKVVTSVAGSGVIARYIEMPLMNDDELKSAVRFEAEKVIPYKLEDIILDSARLEEAGKNRMKVVIVAVKKEVVDTHLKILAEAGLEPSALDIDSFAMMNAFTATGINKEDVCGLLNIGDRRTNLNIGKGGVSYLCRDIDIGGANIAKLIIADNPEEKKNPRILEEKLSSIAKLPPDDRGIIGRYVGDVLSHLADEVRLSFDFYENQHAGGINKVYISGGMTKSGIVESFLKEALGRDILRWDPFTGIDTDAGLDKQALDELRPLLVVSIGLGLRSVL